jgi:2-polyprenyl-3-methyl-5-hydroxy-6-metoxy-1,4-benzoquinol methylase
MVNYYDLKKKMAINLDIQCCDMDTWVSNSSEYSCCRHAKGFYIFLNPEVISKSDEYKVNIDPFTISKDFNNNFHQRRLNCTIDLVKNQGTTPNLRLLDLGCGQGLFTNAFKKEFKYYDVYGLDHSITAIEYASSNFGEIDFVVADAYYPPFEDEYFDIIVCNNIWEHVPDPLNLLKSISRILKPNGQLIISTPSRYRIGNLIRVFLGKEISMSRHHITEYTVGQIREQLKFGGFNIDKIYSPSIKEVSWKVQIIKTLVNYFLKVIKSHHILEATVFYSAIKNNKSIKNFM